MARVLVDTGLAHLDRPFEYLVPADLDADARPGCRVRVRFAGRDHDGFLVERVEEAEHAGRLAHLRRVVSPEAVLTPSVLTAARAVAEHYGGTVGDVLRLAVPPRHARAERAADATDLVREGAPGPLPEGSTRDRGTPVPGPPDTGGAGSAAAWDDHPAGPALLRRLAAGESPWAAWTALPCRPPEVDWPAAVAEAVTATVRGGRGAVVVVPDRRDVERVVAAVEQHAGPGVCVRLTADLGPQARYTAFLAALRGTAPVVVGTRSAAWAPVRRAGLFVCWDDGDDLHQEPRAPYPHVRETLRLRARTEGAALLVGGFVRTVAVQAWIQGGVVAAVTPRPEAVRRLAPRVVVAGEGWQGARDAAAAQARLPSVALQAAREALRSGPVLVQVPRAGYLVAVSCADCHAAARCAWCEGPVGLTAASSRPACTWCARTPDPPGCRVCGSRRVRARRTGDERTAEELGRAFPGVPVVRSGGVAVLDALPDGDPAIVVATPGAEPVATEGYAAALLLDAWELLARPTLDVAVEALRRWSAAAALCRPRAQVVLVGAPPHAGVPAVEALVRWAPDSLAARELRERELLGLPPVRRHAAVRGPRDAVAEVVAAMAARRHRTLGEPVRSGTDEDAWSAVVREEPTSTEPLVRTVSTVRAERSARKTADGVRVVLDGDGLAG